jgi:hypothetical protein
MIEHIYNSEELPVQNTQKTSVESNELILQEDLEIVTIEKQKNEGEIDSEKNTSWRKTMNFQWRKASSSLTINFEEYPTWVIALSLVLIFVFAMVLLMTIALITIK